MDQILITVSVNPMNRWGLRAALQQLVDLLSEDEIQERPGQMPLTGTWADLAWSRERLVRLRNWIRPTSKAWTALARIARDPEGCAREELLAFLGINVRDLPGTLSPIGKFIRKFYKEHLPPPYEQRDLRFTMDPGVARKIREIESEVAG